MLKIKLLFLILLYFVSCQAQEKKIVPQKINLQINYNVTNKYNPDAKEILQLWEDFLSKDSLSNPYKQDAIDFWLKSDQVPMPNNFLSLLRDIKKNTGKSIETVISLIPITKDTFYLKTMFTYSLVDANKIQLELDNILTVYAIRTNTGFKFMSLPQWYINNWGIKNVGKISYCFAKSHDFDNTQALKLDSFNNKICHLFNSEPLSFTYFIGKNVMDAYQIMGFDFAPDAHTVNQIGAIFNSYNKCIFVGNGAEYYPHEVVHLYTNKFWGKDGFYYHSWFDEGIATLFGGSRGYPLEWHLEKLNFFLEQNPIETLNDISKLTTVPNGEYMTEYNYAIGGLICKRIYESKGMDGLFDLLKSGSTDEDFYKAIEKHFGVKRADFGTFIRNELKKK